MTKDLLAYFDIKLISLANYLEVSDDTMRSINTGRRSFSAQQVLWLHSLREALQLNTAVDQLPGISAYDSSHMEKFNTKLKAYIQQKKRSIEAKQCSLAEYKKQYDNLRRGLYACRKLLMAGVSKPNHQKWLDLRERHISQKLQDLSLQIIELESQIQAVKSQIEFLFVELGKRAVMEV